MHLFILPFLFIFLLSSCSHVVQEKLISLGREEKLELRKRIEQARAKNLKAFGSLSWKLPKGSGAANVVLLVDSPHFLRLQVQGPLGDSLGELVVREKAFWFKEGAKKFAWIGKLPFPPAKLKALPYLTFLFSVEEAVHSFLRSPPLEDMQLWKAKASYVGISNGKKGLSRHWLRWDREGNLLKWRIYFSKKEQLVLHYLQYKKWNARQAPYRVEFHFLVEGEENKVFVWHWEQLFPPNFEKKKDTFSLPPSWAKDIPTKHLWNTPNSF